MDTIDPLFLSSHEWFRVEDDIVIVGVSDFAQRQLNDLVFVELPEVGRVVEKKEAIVVLESCKTASDVYSPVEGEIVEVNEALADQPELVNQSPFEDGWLFKVRVEDFDPDEPEYLSQEEYEANLDD